MAAYASSALWVGLRLLSGGGAGSELDGSRLLSALEARPELLAGLQAELQTRDVAACIRQLASPLAGGAPYASQRQGDAVPLTITTSISNFCSQASRSIGWWLRHGQCGLRG